MLVLVGEPMKRYSIRVVWKLRKRMPKIAVSVWLILGLLCLYFLIRLLFPTYQSLDDLQEYEIHIDDVRLWDSHDTKGRRMRLEIITGDQTFYLWYPQSDYIDYKHEVETELLAGKVTTVTAKVVRDQTIRDSLLKRKRVVDLRSDTSVYYDLTTERASLRQDYISICFLYPFLFAVWLFSTLFILLIYGVITFQRK